MVDQYERPDTALADIFDSLLREVHTCLPGRVTAFDRSTQTASVQPCLQRKFKNQDPQDLPVIEDVPVVYPGSGPLWVVFDVAVDSYVLLVFAERSIADWFEKGETVDPKRRRKFNLSDAVAIPGMIPKPVEFGGAVEADTIAIRDEDGTTHVKVDASRNVILNDGTATALAYSRMKTAFDTLKSEVNALVTAFTSHTHLGVPHAVTVVGPAVPPGVAAVADMTAAESATIKVP